ncbi:MAG: hypothetical protein FWG11_04145 [Promicromonosporaceae bacterium]|nr:hypothetical protein [Promicromonosporaceae bacterium]
MPGLRALGLLVAAAGGYRFAYEPLTLIDFRQNPSVVALVSETIPLLLGRGLDMVT